MKKYIIVERNEDFKSCLVINKGTSRLDDIWYSCIPYCIKKKYLKEIKPMTFTTKSNAMIYKKVIQSRSNEDWKENSYIHKMWGKQKQKWEVEVYSGNLF